ncbi:hypothetical protein [Brevibacillus laterosporus]|uniref:hypothetical protein n=1 Tax=Brevibacillus laterosporus TaxID=1465 RepID=UPI001EF361EC|nr:hypothetical protein [Brevibacillus laterosporus]MCG7320199.1 hypothetical protein [Brevibacillus laterosporus]
MDNKTTQFILVVLVVFFASFFPLYNKGIFKEATFMYYDNYLNFSLIISIFLSISIFGSSLVVFTKRQFFLDNSLVYLGSGFILATCLIELIPESLKLNVSNSYYILFGYLFMFMSNSHYKIHSCETLNITKQVDKTSLISTLLFFSIHSFFDGAIIASGFNLNFSREISLLSTLLLHKLPESIAISALILGLYKSYKITLLSGCSFGILTGLGSIIFFLLKDVPGFVYFNSVGIGIASGVLLFTSTMYYSSHSKSSRKLYTIGIIFGVVLSVFLHRH